MLLARTMLTNNNLAIAYRDLAPFSDNPREQIQKAISAYRNALRVFDEAGRHQEYLLTSNSLAIARSEIDRS